MRAKVSLITPCYNGERFIENYIANVTCQTYDCVEVVFINDGSTDRTTEILQQNKKRIEDKGYTFKYLSHENQGVSAAVNSGLKAMTGDYLMLLDMDDRLYPEAIAAKVAYLEANPSFGMVRNNGYYVFEQYPARKWWFKKKDEGDEEYQVFEKLLLAKTFTWPGSYMVRISGLREIYPAMEIYNSRQGQNLQILIPMSYYYKVGYINKFLMEYHIYSTSTSHNNNKGIILNFIKNYEDIKIQTLKRMSIEAKERDRYINRVEDYYLKNQLRLIACMNHKKKFSVLYNERKRRGILRWSDRLLRAASGIPYFSVLYRGIRYMKVLIKKDIF